MSALTVMFVRHAEKPLGRFPGGGTTIDGTTDDKSLVVRGWQRAGAWAALFGSDLRSADYPHPNVVYAAKAEPVTKKAKFSHRPFETALPLAERLGLTLRTDYGVSQERELADEIRKLTGVVIAFWEHKAIVTDLIPALKEGQIIPGVPTKWDSDRFDVVLRFDRAMPDAPWSFRQLSPRLMSGDSDGPFSEREG
ncbi:histidine phosphatase family protein [Methylobacterium sp. NEAU K]|uniref:histidine phosphatase family protein n=1 Tax=Methylobacterium sp. NEAU K TaxID=3064946 RepID=UPI002732E8CB|nr:histidine phosphatase family protein [Methylobacterium sp. NEAU K]MDP4005462.1 histidine phosphatase family protein [Methylobacterium sp. NEAU K]